MTPPAGPTAASPDSPESPDGPGPIDPVLRRREQWRALVQLGQRLGYGLYLVAIVGFILGFARNFDGVAVTIIEIGLIGGSVFLAPAMVFVYAIKAAERADRDGDWR